MEKRGVIEAYEENQLAVAISDLRAVCGALTDRAVDVGEPEQDPRLGLALLTLQGVRAATEQVCAKDSGLAGRAIQARPGGPASGEPSDLDILICSLREGFRKDYAGWVPTFGKNRVIEPVRGLPYIGGGGEGDPYFGGRGDPRAASSTNGGTSGPPGWPQPRDDRPGQGVRVGVLDTPLYPNEWLAGGYIAAAKDLPQVPAPGSPLPASAGHATFIAGLILSRAPGAELIIRPALNDRAVGKAWDVAKDMASFIGSGVDILNLSFGCYTDDGEPPLVLTRAVSLLSAEIVLVAAAGNHGDIGELTAVPDWTRGLTPKTPVWPAAFDEVIAVGATDGNNLAAFSPRTPWVNLVAPGVDVESTYLTGEVKPADPGQEKPLTFNGFAYWDGTSFSAAAVSGAVAAKIQPGRRDARQALECIRNSPEDEIRPFTG
jgi:membrane-anchored mycosin MYCP